MANVVGLLASLLGNMVENSGEIIGNKLVPRPIPELSGGRAEGGVATTKAGASSISNPNVVSVIGKDQWQVLVRRIQ